MNAISCTGWNPHSTLNFEVQRSLCSCTQKRQACDGGSPRRVSSSSVASWKPYPSRCMIKSWRVSSWCKESATTKPKWMPSSAKWLMLANVTASVSVSWWDRGRLQIPLHLGLPGLSRCVDLGISHSFIGLFTCFCYLSNSTFAHFYCPFFPLSKQGATQIVGPSTPNYSLVHLEGRMCTLLWRKVNSGQLHNSHGMDSSHCLLQTALGQELLDSLVRRVMAGKITLNEAESQLTLDQIVSCGIATNWS